VTGCSTQIARYAGLLVVPFLVFTTWFALAPAGYAQRASSRPIRVESNQVLVPALVWNQRLWESLLRTTPRDPAAYRDIPIRNLAASDFQVFEDGRGQMIEKVTPEDPSVLSVRDSMGEHYEYTTAAGRWIYPDIPDFGKGFMAMTWPTYLIVYTPPMSPEGSCHQLEVRIINHPDAAAFARSGYCKTTASASDPLNGTKFGQEMEADLNSATNGNIGLSLGAVVSPLEANLARVHIVLEFDPKSLHYELKWKKIGNLYETIGMIGRIYAQDGSIAARFSDFACCDYSYGAGLDWLIIHNWKGNILFSPAAYETQVYLPAGEYKVRVVLSDGRGFGRAEIPLSIERHDRQRLALGGLCISKHARKTQGEPKEAAAKQVGRFIPLGTRDLEITPAANASFRKREALYYYFEVNEPQFSGQAACTGAGDCKEPLLANLKIVEANSGEARKYLPAIDVAPGQIPEGLVVPFIGKVDIGQLARGSYRLEVQATDSAGRATPWRSANFTIQ